MVGSCLLVFLLSAGAIYWNHTINSTVAQNNATVASPEEQQVEIEKNLSFEVSPMFMEQGADPLDSYFSVTNNSAIGLEKHQLICHINMLLSDGNVRITKSDGETIRPDFDSSLAAGEHETDQCLGHVRKFARLPPIQCLDVSVYLDYVVAKKEVKQSKRQRFVARQDKGRWVWTNEPEKGPQGSYCEYVVR